MEFASLAENAIKMEFASLAEKAIKGGLPYHAGVPGSAVRSR